MNVTRRGGEEILGAFMILVVVVFLIGGAFVIRNDMRKRDAWKEAMVQANADSLSVGSSVYLTTEFNARRGVVLSVERGGAEQSAKIRVRLPPTSGTDYTEATFLPTELWVHQ